MNKANGPMGTAVLPQYAPSNNMMERFLDAIQASSASIARAENIPGFKCVEDLELRADALRYFIERKAALEDEFVSDLSEVIGCVRTTEFCDVIAHCWCDGRARRESIDVQRLKASVHEHLRSILRNPLTMIDVVAKANPPPCSPSFSTEEVMAILEVNDRLLYAHIESWLEEHPNSENLSRGDVFFHRGLGLVDPFPDGATYREHDYINSYSLSISVPEQFAQIQHDSKPVLRKRHAEAVLIDEATSSNESAYRAG